MSRPRYYWHNMVRKQIMLNKTIAQSEQRDKIREAMAETDRETLKLPNGEERLYAVKAVLIEQSKNYDGVAYELNYDWHTIQKWVNTYVNQVGKRAGY